MYGLQKNEAADVTGADIEAFQLLAVKYLRLSDYELAELLAAEDLQEVHCEESNL